MGNAARTLTVLVSLLVSGVCRAETTAANWAMHCAKCHASDGSGATPYGMRMHARNYRDPAVQATFTDEQAVDRLANGLVKDGKPQMPAYMDRLSSAELKELVAFLRKLAPAPAPKAP